MFSKIASSIAYHVGKPWYFCLSLLVIVLWAGSYPFFGGDLDTWQLVVNTGTTIITFLLVTLLQNSQQNFEDATNKKLNAIAMGVGDLLEREDMPDRAKELYDVMGIEET